MGTAITQKRKALEFAQSDFGNAFEKPTPDILRFYADQVLVVTRGSYEIMRGILTNVGI